MQRIIHAALGVVMLALAAGTAAQKPIVYPAKGQSAEKQDKDDAECYSWAKKSSGVDPALAAGNTPPPAGPGGERLRGAARGAIGGAVIGGIVGGEAGTGAGVGAVAGTMAGGHRARQREAAANQQAQNQQAAMSSYYRAYGACMSGRGYTVS